VFVQLDAPFVDVLVRLEDLGGDQWSVDDDALKVVAGRSGDVVALGDRMIVEIIDTAIMRRTVYGRRVGGEGHGDRKLTREQRRGSGKKPDDRKPGRPGKPGHRGKPEPKGNRGGGKPSHKGGRPGKSKGGRHK
jgi:ribonuclease R